MSNVHPFPAGGKSAKPNRKNNRRANSNHAAYGPALLLQGIDDHPVDVLDSIIQAGSLYLSPSDARPDERLEDTPSAQFLSTIQGMNVLTDAANVLIHQAKKHPERKDQEAVDGLVQRAKAMQKLIRKLDEMLPQDEFILSSDSFGPDVLTEYATNAAMLVVSYFAEALLDYYDARFIQTRKATPVRPGKPNNLHIIPFKTRSRHVQCIEKIFWVDIHHHSEQHRDPCQGIAAEILANNGSSFSGCCTTRCGAGRKCKTGHQPIARTCQY